MVRFSSKNCFLLFLILSVLFISALLAVNLYRYNSIVLNIYNTQRVEDERFESLLLKVCKHSNGNSVELQDSFLALVEKHYEELENELEESMSDFQSYFVVLSIWAGVITIVFLIFSIYSVFRTDEMLTRANDSLIKIQESQNRADTIIRDLTVQQETYLRDLSQKIQILENRAIVSIGQKEQLLSKTDFEKTKHNDIDKTMCPQPKERPRHPKNKK